VSRCPVSGMDKLTVAPYKQRIAATTLRPDLYKTPA
jgi:hypothetical protein